MTEWFNAAASLFGKVIDAAKSIFLFLFIQNSAKTEIRYEQLKSQQKILEKRLQITARPRSSWNDLLERMRNEKL